MNNKMNIIIFYKRITEMKYIGLFVTMLLCTYLVQAQVVVTSAGNVDMCVGGVYKTIPDFKVAEKQNTDFAASTSLQTYELNAPNNFEFNPGQGFVTTPSSTDISFAYLNVTATKITLNYFLNATAKKDSFIFKNIQVRAVGTNSANDLRFSGGSASQNQNNTNQYAHAHFNSAQANVNLSASPKVVCKNASDIALNGSPGGGSFTAAPGVSGSVFKPSLVSPGTYVVTYTATNNGCTASDTVRITVNTIPSVTFFGLGSSYCSNDSTNIQLVGFPSGSGGVFSGNGTSGSNGSMFKPYTAGIGTNIPVKYEYTDANGCKGSSQVVTNILEAPTVTLVLKPNNLSYSIYDPGVEITGTQFNPATGGIISLSGDGVSNSTGLFTPSAAGVGEHVITRSLKAPNGCVANKTQKVTVTSSNSVYIIGLDSKYCEYNGPVNLTSGFANAKFSGDGITANDPNTSSATFDPRSIQFIGQQTTVFITVIVDILGIQFPYVQPTIIYKKPIVIISQDTARNSVNFKTKFCNQDPIVPLNVYVLPAGGAGNFSGNGVNGTNFNPALATPNTTITYSYQDNNGCQNTDTKTVQIYSVTDNLDFGSLEPSYCANSDTVDLKATQNNLEINGGSYSGNGINGNKFIPSLAASYNTGLSNTYEIKYIYGNTAGCLTTVSKNVVVNRLTEANLTGLNNAYCLNNSDVNLSGTPSSNGIGSFSIKSLLSTTNVLDNNKFNVKKASVGTYYLTYTYKDNTTKCTSYDTDTTLIRSIPVVSFSNLDSAYCMSNKNIPLYGSPSGNKGIFSSSTADVSGITKSLDITKSRVGKHIIKYTFTDEFGCASSDSLQTIIYDSPSNLNIKLSSICEKDTIKFDDNNSQLISNVDAASFIKNAVWKIDTTTFIKSFGDSPKITLSSGNHKVNYTLTTDKGCFTSFDKDIIIGSYPKTSFTWDEICNNEDTKFKNTTPGLDVGVVNKVVWDFSDPLKPNKISINVNSSVKGDTSHTYITPVSYKVFLTAYSDYSCIATDSHNIFILESKIIKKSDPYSNDFNDLISDWVPAPAVETVPPSWDLGVPNKKYIQSTNGAWVTSLSKSFNIDEQSYVYSPCFTIDESITKPMIHLDVWSRTNLNSSGANLQYSRNGREWFTLGKRNESGVNWYNNTGNIASRPAGSQLDQDGWTDTMQSWKNARHIFDNELGSNKNIRFRISFAGNKDTTDGFAFDNVWIGDRNRLILAEHFTNSSSKFTKVENDTINNVVARNLEDGEPKDIVSLQYHTAFPGYDPMNARNIPDAGARSLYYGVTQVPYSSIDGSYLAGNTVSVVTQKTIDTRSLYDPAFEIILNPKITDTTVTGYVQLTNKIPVKNTVTVYVSLLERFVNISGANGEKNYQWVHSKFLPDAAGTSFRADWSGQLTQKVDLDWKIPANYFYNPDKLAMIAFVQDNVTKEIYQTAYKGIGTKVTTDVFNPAESTSTISLYPNPANDVTTVVLNGKLKGNYNWLIIDEMGRVVDQGTLASDTEGFTINTQNYSSGFYTLRLSNSSDGVKTQKFVVVH